MSQSLAATEQLANNSAKKFHSANTHLSDCLWKENTHWVPSMCALRNVHLLKWPVRALGCGETDHLGCNLILTQLCSFSTKKPRSKIWFLQQQHSDEILLMQCWLVAACNMFFNWMPGVKICLWPTYVGLVCFQSKLFVSAAPLALNALKFVWVFFQSKHKRRLYATCRV